VCAAAGLAVLDEIERLGLRAHAVEVGRYLRESVKQLGGMIGMLIGLFRSDCYASEDVLFSPYCNHI
jgi:4-aminobutyrate aminotransferase-like enzyme